MTARRTAWIGICLAMPFFVLFSMALLRIEPDFGPLQSWMISPDPDQPDVGSSLLALVTFLLLFAAFVMNFKFVLRALRAGQSLLAHPANLALAVSTLSLIMFVVGSIVVDQWPCWMSVPNSD